MCGVFILILCLTNLGQLVTGAEAAEGFGFYEDLFRTHGAVMMMVDPDTGEIVFVNDAAASYYGYSLDEMHDMLISQINTLSPAEISVEMQRAVAEERNYFLFKHRLSDGRERDVEVVSYPVNVGGRPLLFSIITDVSDRIVAEVAEARDQKLRFFVVLGALILALIALFYQLYIHRQRNRALRELDHTYSLQKLTTEVAAQFAGASGEELSSLMDSAVMRCAQFLGADRAHLCFIDPEGSVSRRVFAWTGQGMSTVKADSAGSVKDLPWITGLLAMGRTVLISDYGSLPPEADIEKQYFQAHGVKSKLALPIMVDGVAVAFWGMETVQKRAEWTEETAVTLELLSGVFAAAIERRRAHQHLLFWQDLLQYVVEHSPAAIAVLDRDMKYMFVSRRFLTDYRVKDADIVGKSHYEVFPEVPERWRRIHQRVLTGEIEKSDHEVFPRPDGSVDYTRFMLRPWHDTGGAIGGMIMYLEVITEQYRREQALRESEERFRLLVETAPDAIFLYSGYQIAYVNQAAVNLLRADSAELLVGRGPMEWLHPSFYEAVRERYRILLEDERSVPAMEQVYMLFDGSELEVEVAATPIPYNDKPGALVYVRDISDRKKREADRLAALLDYRQQQRLESIGTLASGVAHEINNPVMGIINYAQLIMDDMPGDPVADYAKAIVGEGERVTEITRALLYYSRQEKQAHSPARIEDIIGRTLTLVQKLFYHDHIRIELDIAENLPDLKCRSQQVQQVIMNLLTNARDALNERYSQYHEDKLIRISVDMFHEEGRRWMKIAVEDHGKGIPAEVGDRIFDPFFTSKGREAGTGLGLPISQGIAHDHHGRLHYD